MRGHEQSIKQEIDILSKVKHPNLLQLLDWGVGATQIFLVTEYAAGGELFDRIVADGKFSEFDAATVMCVLMDALAYLHALGICHRDLKPENIFMRDPQHRDFTDIVIGDFGVSKMYDQQHTMMRSQIGTYGYAAPEIMMALHPYTSSADMFSVGVIAYVLMSGTFPYSTDSFDSELEDILQHKLTFDE